jgi:hypothetical protein
MALTASISAAVTTRFVEVQEFLSFISRGEKAPPERDPIEVRLMRGLFYVHLYGAFEFSVNRIVVGASQVINQAQVPHSNVAHPLGALVLDRNFNSLSQVGRHWPKRLELIQQRLSTTIAQIDDGSMETQNIWLHTLEQIFKVFGLTQPPVFDVTKAGYIREVVEARNKIAHGEDSPLVYGSLKRCTELQLVHDAIRAEAFYILDCFNDYIDAQAYKLVP